MRTLGRIFYCVAERVCPSQRGGNQGWLSYCFFPAGQDARRPNLNSHSKTSPPGINMECESSLSLSIRELAPVNL